MDAPSSPSQAEYAEAAYQGGFNAEEFTDVMGALLTNVAKNMKEPFKFQPFHASIRSPYDFYKFGHRFVQPLIMWDQSFAEGLEVADEIEALVAKGDNVILLANHQTEADPQVCSRAPSAVGPEGSLAHAAPCCPVPKGLCA